jgi:16S rRNA (cytidine1402-2'-O)-methyltransferase
MQTDPKLYLIPALLGSEDASLIPEHTKQIVYGLDSFIVENLRSARRYLRAIGYTKNFDTEVKLVEFDKHATQQSVGKMLQPMKSGRSIGIISEAGLPCIADPGNEVVEHAHKLGIEVVPLVGPGSIFLALMASGFSGQHFSFHGYLPIQAADRIKKIKQLDDKALRKGGTQIFMETPYRNQKLLEDILAQCSPASRLCIAADVTLPTQQIKTLSIEDWRKTPIDLNKRFAVFLLG